MKISVCKDKWRDAYQRALDLNFENVKTLNTVPWNKLRVVLRNMQTKYQKDPNGFHNFMEIAKAMWREEREGIGSLSLFGYFKDWGPGRSG